MDNIHKGNRYFMYSIYLQNKINISDFSDFR